MSGYMVLRHSQHEGYYSPNNTANKATPYIFDTVVKSSDGRQIGMRFKGTSDREWVIIYVPSTDFTPTYNNVIRLINDNKDVSNRKVVIRENEKAKAARIVTNFFNSPSIAGNEKMTSYVKKPQYLKHSDDLDIIDVSDEVLEHAIGIKATHYLPLTSDVRSPRASYNNNDDAIHVHWTIDQTPVDTKFTGYTRNNRGNIVFNSMSVEYCKDTIKRYGTGYLNEYKDSRAVWDDGRLTQMARNMHNQLQSAIAQASNQLTGVGVRHSLFTEVFDMDDYIEHHGVLGMKWGVRRYQNKDGSLTAEGRKHYNVKTINSTRMELASAESDREKRTILTKATNKAMGDQVKGIVAGTGSMVAGSLAKQAVARAAAGTLVRNLVYDSLTGTSSLITSVIPAAVPAWAAALTTPVGQIALAAVGTAGAAKAIYGAYKSLKLNELAAEFDVSTNVNRIVREQTSVNSAVERGMQEYRENKANRMINALDSNNSAAYEKERNSIKDDYEKDRMEYVVDRVRAARQSGKYDMEFLEKGLDQNQRTGEDLEGKDLDEAYLRYLLEKEKS